MLISISKDRTGWSPLIYRTYCSNLNYFRHPDRVPTWDQHQEWWDHIFDTADLWIITGGVEHEKYMGYVRVDKTTHEVSIALDVEHQCHGYGSTALKFFDPNKVHVEVMEHNLRGIHFFEKLGIRVKIIKGT